MKSLENKITTLEELLSDADKLNKTLYNMIKAVDWNDDGQLSRAEFQVAEMTYFGLKPKV